jgi:hypothetical protein
MAYLKLLSQTEYSDSFDTMDFCKIGCLIQDPVYHVRLSFVEKLCRDTAAKIIPTKYCIWLLLAAHEPEVELLNKVIEILTTGEIIFDSKGQATKN